MNITQQKIDTLNGLLQVKVTKEDYAQKVEQSIKKYAKQMQIPGFRKGMAPIEMVRAKVGKGILVEEVSEMVAEQVRLYVTDNKLNILGYPLPKSDQQIDWAAAELSFDYEIAYRPVFELPLDKKIEVEKIEVDITDSDVDHLLQMEAKRRGKMNDVELSDQQSNIFARVEEINEQQEKIPNGLQSIANFEISEIEEKMIQEKFIGLAKEAKIVVTQKELQENKSVYEKLLSGRSNKKIEEIQGDLAFTIVFVAKIEPAIIDEEFFKQVYGPEVSTLEMFKEKTKVRLADEIKATSDFKFKEAVDKSVLAKINMELPDEFLKKYIQLSNEKPVTKEQVDHDYPKIADQFKLELLESAIIEKYKIKIDHQEMITFAKELLQQNMQQTGAKIASDDELNKMAHELLSDKQRAQNLYHRLLEKEMAKVYAENITVKSKKVSYKDFYKQF